VIRQLTQPTVFTDDEFRRALWWRLGLRQAPEGATCRLHAAGAEGRPCGQGLAGNAEHAVTCKKDQAKPDTPGTIGSCRREAVPDGPYKGVRALSPAPTRSVRERAGMLALILSAMLNPKQVKISLTRACRGAYGEGVCAKPCQEDKPSSYAHVVVALPGSGPRRREGRPGHGGHPPRHPGHPASVEVGP
jgi:hypothetical protein